MTMLAKNRPSLRKLPVSRFQRWKIHTGSAQPVKSPQPQPGQPRRVPIPAYGLTVWEG